MPSTPHKEKLLAAIENPKCRQDAAVLKAALDAYTDWIRKLDALSSTGTRKVAEMTKLLNEYKDLLEVELIAQRGSAFLKRQKGQLKLDNSVLEEFLVRLVDPSVLQGLPGFELEVGPQTAFMSLSFRPVGISSLDRKPELVLKVKDQDFAIGRTLHYKFSSNPAFEPERTSCGKLFLAVLAAECKVNLDKTMFQECAGTAARLKQGCPVSKYFALVEYLDMEPEDPRLTDINNVFLLRHARRLPFEKRDVLNEVRNLHQAFPIDPAIIARFVAEIQAFINAVWYNPNEVLKRGSFA
jgi:hypothetical protein